MLPKSCIFNNFYKFLKQLEKHVLHFDSPMANQKQSSLNTRVLFQEKIVFCLESLYRVDRLKNYCVQYLSYKFCVLFLLSFVWEFWVWIVVFLLLLSYFKTIRKWSRRLPIFFLCFYILVVRTFGGHFNEIAAWHIVIGYYKRRLIGWKKCSIVL